MRVIVSFAAGVGGASVIMAQSSADTALPGGLWRFGETWGDVFREEGTEKGT